MAARRRVATKPEKPRHPRKSLLSWILNAEERLTITRRIEWVLFVGACLLALWLNVVLYDRSGAFWRDEASSLHVAGAPGLGTIWARLSDDSSPVLTYGALRLWTAAGIGASDGGLRAFGTLVALGIVVSLFVSCRSLTGRVPLLAMALTAFNVALFYFGSSLRSYGMAALFIMPCLAAFGRVVQRPTRWNVLASLVLALLSCHTSYQNSYLLFAIGVAGAVACAACRLWRRAMLVLVICSVAALSMLVYLPAIRAYRQGSEIQSVALSLPTIGEELASGFSGGSAALLYTWVFLALAGSISLIVHTMRGRQSALQDRTPSLAVYCLVAAAVAVAVDVTFIWIHGLPVLPWHCIPLLAFVSVVAEVAFQSRRNRAWVWCLRMGLAYALIVLSLPHLGRIATLRRTNVDCANSILAEKASPHDLILVDPFWLAPSFKYYYRAKAEWDTIPLTSSEQAAGENLFVAVRRLMATPNAIDPTLRRIESTLASGHRLWLVGPPEFFASSTIPPDLPAAPLPSSGWNCDPYIEAWSRQVCCYIRTHARTVLVVPVEAPQPVNGLENVALVLVEGWRPQ
jgi:hypothetical protein